MPERARELDQIPLKKRGLLHGVAIGVKDVNLTEYMPAQCKSPMYEGDTPKLDVASIMTLRENGALIFSMQSLCYVQRVHGSPFF
jgi:Asp-tRNA(Asn)/Glu-tRNA(Gln) amidotransferase A subunit family amidase